MRIDTRLTRLEERLQPQRESENARFERLVECVFDVVQDREWHNAETLHTTVLEPQGFAWEEFAPQIHHWAELHFLDRREYYCNAAKSPDYRLPERGEGQGASWCQRWNIDISNGQIFHTKGLLDRGVTDFTDIDRAAIVEAARVLRLRRTMPIWGPGPYGDMSPHEDAILRMAEKWEARRCA